MLSNKMFDKHLRKCKIPPHTKEDTNMTPTHTLKLADGYGSTPCEILAVTGPLATVRVNAAAYWERDRFEVRVVRAADVRPTA